ncbi:D-alanine--D-alanine ligase [Deltaproteobacteria bacterium TL4]
MKIGITYDLREEYLAMGYSEEETVEFDRPDTIEGIEQAVQQMGYETERIGHIKKLASLLVQGNRWDLVFNIAEGVHGFGREAQVPCLLEAYGLPYTFSDPLRQTLTLHKGMTKHVIRDLGIPTPDFLVVKEESEVERLCLPFPVFAKPVAEGTGRGINEDSKVHNITELRKVCRGLLETYQQPVLVETFLPGRELTVGITGTGKKAKVMGVMEVLLQANAERDIYTYSNKAHYEDRVKYRVIDGVVAEESADVALRSWRGLGCFDGGRIDLRMDAQGVPNFLEVNPLPGLNPQHSDLPILCRLAGISYLTLIREIVESALERVKERVKGVL